MDRRHFTSLHSTHKPLFWYIGVCCGVAVATVAAAAAAAALGAEICFFGFCFRF